MKQLLDTLFTIRKLPLTDEVDLKDSAILVAQAKNHRAIEDALTDTFGAVLHHFFGDNSNLDKIYLAVYSGRYFVTERSRGLATNYSDIVLKEEKQYGQFYIQVERMVTELPEIQALAQATSIFAQSAAQRAYDVKRTMNPSIVIKGGTQIGLT